MDLRFASLLFLLAVAAASAAESSLEMAGLMALVGEEASLDSSAQCNALVGDCINEEDEMASDSEADRRGLQRRFNFISYQALFKNSVPCNRRGYSYYNCKRGGARRANPYRRGCTYITNCRRTLD